METSSNQEEGSFRKYKMCIYELNPNPGCEITLQIDYLFLGFLKPTIPLKKCSSGDTLRQKLIDEISGIELTGRLDISKDAPANQTDAGDWYHAVRERILNG